MSSYPIEPDELRAIVTHYLTDDHPWFVSDWVAHWYGSHNGPRWRFWLNRLLGRRCWCGRTVNP